MSGISGQSEYSRNQFFERTGSEWTSEVEYTYDVAERLVRTQRTSRGRRWVGDEIREEELVCPTVAYQYECAAD